MRHLETLNGAPAWMKKLDKGRHHSLISHHHITIEADEVDAQIIVVLKSDVRRDI